MNQFIPDGEYNKGTSGYRWQGGSVRHINSRFGSARRLDEITRMMEHCTEHHKVCIEVDSSLSNIRRLPKRVVHVGPEDNTGIHVFEHAYNTERIDKQYVALSHCWGQTTHPELRHDNYQQRLDNIPYTDLPVLYKDAINLTRQLGLQYIWIDSLCIIQGDEADFFDQGSKMALIYEGSHIVFSSTSSHNGDIPLFNECEPFGKIVGETKAGEEFTIYARKACSHQVLGNELILEGQGYMMKDCSMSWDVEGTEDERFHVVGSENYPLHHRAWCYQERILGLRVLHFARQEMLFECLTSLDCECGFFAEHQADPLFDTRRAVKFGRGELGPCMQLEDLRASLQSRQDIYKPKLSGQPHSCTGPREAWRDLVLQYSQKRLSDPTDGLAAIGGLAERWADPAETGRYLAGVWEKDLYISLRWMPDTEEPETIMARKLDELQQRQPHRKVDRYIAPSWSWASIQRGVAWHDTTYDFEEDEYFISFDLSPDRTSCTIKDKGFVFGPVQNGYIFMTGEIMSLQFYLSEDGNSIFFGKYNIWKHISKVDSIMRLQQQPTLDGRFEKKHPLRKLWCLRYCTKPIPAFEGGGIGSEGALLLVEARSEILERQPVEVRGHQWVFERVGFTYQYMTEDWNHREDSKRVSLYLL